jgi:hypothetical protein
MTTKKAATILAIAATVLLFTGCGPTQAIEEKIVEEIAEEIIENETGAEIENLGEEGMKITIPGEEGEEAVEMTFNMDGGEVPEMIKGEIPVANDSEVISSTEYKDISTTATFKTPLTAEEVKDFYLSEMDDGEWEKQAELNFGGQNSLSFLKGAKMLTISIFGSDEETNYSINYTIEG